MDQNQNQYQAALAKIRTIKETAHQLIQQDGLDPFEEAIVIAMLEHIGIHAKIPGLTLRQTLRRHLNMERLTEKEVRSAIAKLRMKGYPIIGISAGGYYWAEDRDEVLSYIEGELTSLINTLLRKRRIMKQTMKFFGQESVEQTQIVTDTELDGWAMGVLKKDDAVNPHKPGSKEAEQWEKAWAEGRLE